VSTPISRRRSLTVLSAWAASPVVLSCADDRKSREPTDDAEGGGGGGGGTTCSREVPTDLENWVPVSLTTVPALEGEGAARFDDGSALLHVWLLDDGDGCYRAVWRICTHGACEVEYAGERGDFECPCHGSRFGRDGAALNGPATRPLRVLEARRVDDTLYVRRPF
jgi:Rieske Fe-S protein